MKETVRLKEIKTRLVGREEVFRIMALGESLRLPVLLEGPPGTAKSNAMYDYAEGKREEVFLVELDTGSKASEVKGFMNMRALLEEKRYETFSPIASKRFIQINEVEKGSSDIRNTLLSIMQERQLQLGSEGTKDCVWEVFVGTCNSIPADERREPFWDRFQIKHKLDPLTPEEMKLARRRVEHVVRVPIPSEEQIASVKISEKMIDAFDNITSKVLSDRVRVAIPRLAAGVKLIWNTDDYQALCKVASFVCPELTSSIASSLIPKEINEMKSLVKNIDAAVDYDAKSSMFSKLTDMFTKYVRSRDKDPEMVALVKGDIMRITDMMEAELQKRTKEATAAAEEKSST